MAVWWVGLTPTPGRLLSCLRRIWVHKISFFVPYLRDVTLLTIAQAWLSRCSGFAQAGLTFAHPNYHFRQATKPTNRFSSSLGGSELVPYIKIARIYPIFEPICLCVFILVFLSAQ